jgi:hypothetical protein
LGVDQIEDMPYERTWTRQKNAKAELRVLRLCSTVRGDAMIKSILTPVLLGFIVAFANTRRPARA